MKKCILILAVLFCQLNTYAQSPAMSGLSGLYKCSSEDLVLLNSDGTGRMVMSYNFEGIRSFTWEYDDYDEVISIAAVLPPPGVSKYEAPPIFLDLNVKVANEKIVLLHYTSGPTFLYIKQ